MMRLSGVLMLAVGVACVIAGSSTYAHAQENLLSTKLEPRPKTRRIGVISAGWRMGLEGQSFANEKEQARTAGFGLRGDIRYGLLPTLEMKAEAGVSLQSGYAQSRFGDNTPRSGLDLREALVQWKPLSRVTLQAGAINQSQVEAPLLVSGQPFPGALERVLLGTKAFNVELKAEQAVPTSTNLSAKTVEAETTPTFMTEILTVRAKAGDRVSLSAHGLHYAFKSLPTTVAAESELFGNTVIPLTGKTSTFAYEFDGYGYGGGVKVLMARTLSWNLDAQVLQNTKAPASFGAGQIVTSGFNIGLKNDVDLKPQAEMFYAESDVAPAFYNGSDRGHNNRTGWGANLEAVFKEAGFLVGGRFVQSNLINESTVQSRQSFFMIRFETLYDLL
jgi:hypothetical protein